jgi:hypothetical protein
MRVATTSEWPQKQPKYDYSYYYTTTTLYNDPYSIVIDSWRLSDVQVLCPILSHRPQRRCWPLEPTCGAVLLTTSVQS